MMAAAGSVHAGKLALDQKVTIDTRFQDKRLGTFQHCARFWITLRGRDGDDDAIVATHLHRPRRRPGGALDVQRYTEAVGLTGNRAPLRAFRRRPGPTKPLDRVTKTTANDQGCCWS